MSGSTEEQYLVTYEKENPMSDLFDTVQSFSRAHHPVVPKLVVDYDCPPDRFYFETSPPTVTMGPKLAAELRREIDRREALIPPLATYEKADD